MSELRMISPLLDHMMVEKETAGHSGQTCYILRHKTSGEHFVLKCLSLPETDSRIRALILSGAYPDEKSVHAYYGRLAEDIRAELEVGQKLAASGCFAGALSYQIEPKDSGVGYDIYILYPLNVSLSDFLATNAMTGLRALNLGLDLCDSITACREAGYLYVNLCPDNIFLMPTGKFLLGDLGLTSLQDLQYASVPEEYIGAYSAPELSDIAASPNLTTDLYSLGMVLYRIYNGNHGPFEDESTSEAMSDKLRLTGKPMPSPIYADYELANIILKACAFRPDDRYQHPEDLRQALTLYMQRNAVSDSLIVPPIVADPEPVPIQDEEPEEEPVRMTDVDELDEDFRQNFAPDKTGGGEETVEQPEPEAPEEAPIPVIIPGPEEKQPEPAEEKAPEDQPAEEPAEVPAEKPADEPEKDPDQMDLDELLASVNDVLGEEKPEPKEPEPPEEKEEAPEEKKTEGLTMRIVSPEENSPDDGKTEDVTHDYVDGKQDDEEEPEKPRKKSKALMWIIIVVLLLAIGALGYFLLSWYFVGVTELKSVSTTPSQIVVELVTDENPAYFEVTCADSYGNVYHGTRDGNQYSFTELREKTSYTITVDAAKYHDFTGAVPVLTETTNELTEISNFGFERLNTDGDVLLSFSHKGPIPAEWQLSYEKKDGSDSHTYRFDGESYQINGLELYETYVFTLENTDNIYLSGTYSMEYEVLPRVTVSDFSIKSIEDSVVTVTWEHGETDPGAWTVTCEAEGMEPISVDTKETRAQLPLPDLKRDYTILLDAAGMDKKETLVLTANPIIVNNLRAEPDENGDWIVTWDTPAGEPEGQWRVAYRVSTIYYDDSAVNLIPSVACPADGGNKVTLKYLPAEADMEISLIALDTDTNSYPAVFGATTIKIHTGEASAFQGFELTPQPPYGDGYTAKTSIALWEKPQGDVWDYRDLVTNRRDNYSVDEEIALCIQIDGAIAAEDTVCLSYLVRNENGEVVAFDSRDIQWASIWFSRRHTGKVPMPLTSDADGNTIVQTGNFTVEVYVNGMLLAAKNFTLE